MAPFCHQVVAAKGILGATQGKTDYVVFFL